VGVARPLRVPCAADLEALAEGDSDGVRAALAVPPPLDAVEDVEERGVTEELPEGEGVASATLGEGAPVRLADHHSLSLRIRSVLPPLNSCANSPSARGFRSSRVALAAIQQRQSTMA
jgi:hypothetical protein